MQKRTRGQYNALYDNPASLFGTAEVVIFPQGRPEIILKSRDGKRGIRLTAADSVSGLSVELAPLPNTEAFSVFPSVDPSQVHSEGGQPVIDQSPRLSIVQYREDSRPIRLLRRVNKLKAAEKKEGELVSS